LTHLLIFEFFKLFRLGLFPTVFVDYFSSRWREEMYLRS
jgi:hypothetical protein